MTTTPRIWFITGVSRGFGKALAEAVLARGEVVVGTTRRGAAAIAGPTGRLHLLPLELTDAPAIRSTVERAQALYGRLDVIVNNAGYGLLGPVEEAGEAEIAHLFEVDFHGPRRIIQAALPLLRRQRSGHIVNITSIAGLAPGPGSGFYAAAKFALEGLSQSLAQELAPLGIRLTLVEPGAFRTEFLSDDSIRCSGVTIDDYRGTAGATVSHLAELAGHQAGDPAKAAAAVIEAVDAPVPPLHLVLGPDAFRRVQDKLARFHADLERWQALSLGTDFDAEPAAA
jgi:NAD(P)-dependent dehydrogenase (short-subunit alcohol dehydrogenase family)